MRALIVALLFSFPAHAQCWAPAKVEQTMAERWNERIVNIGVARGGDLVRLYVNRETGTWTMTILQTPDRECVMSAGQDWRDLSKS